MSAGFGRRSWAWLLDLGVAALLATGYGAPVAVAVVGAVSAIGSAIHPALMGVGSSVAAVVALVAWALACLRLYQGIRDRGRGRYLTAVFVLVLGVLPAWGLAINYGLLAATCRTSSCDVGPAMFRAFGVRGVVGLVTLHAVTALAFAASRRRPEKLPAGAEVLVHALLLFGVGLQLLLAVQLADFLWGLVVFPISLPLVGPYVSIALYAHELVARLRRRGADALAGAPVLAGLYAVVMAAVQRRPAAALEVFTDTCGHALSRLPVTHLTVHDCHYLCTVAARGTPRAGPWAASSRTGHPAGPGTGR